MVDCCSAPGLLPFQQALTKMLAAVIPVEKTETLVIGKVLGRVLAHDISSPLNVPPHDNSAMDGYAFSHDSLNGREFLTLAGRSMAGAPFQGECPKGHCIRIMTGAKMPQSCDTVEMQENCHVEGESIRFLEHRNTGDNVRYTGEDITKGHIVFALGRKLSAIDVGVLASLGIESIDVMVKLTIGLIATGDELKEPGQSLTEGDIYESNSHAVGAMLKKLDVNIINYGIISDEEHLIKAAFEQADQQCDAVISSGGVSVGDADYTKLVLEQLGEVNFWKIAMKPGKPFAFGKLPNSVFFGLPGNPVSALVTAHQLVIPALLKMQNCHRQIPLMMPAKTMTNLRKSPGRMDFQRGVVSRNEHGELVVHSTGSQGSGVLTSLAMANCYIVLPAKQGKVLAGETVDIQLFDEYIQ